MLIINAFKDFADGLSRGFGLFFSQRNDHTEAAVTAGFGPRRRR